MFSVETSKKWIYMLDIELNYTAETRPVRRLLITWLVNTAGHLFTKSFGYTSPCGFFDPFGRSVLTLLWDFLVLRSWYDNRGCIFIVFVSDWFLLVRSMTVMEANELVIFNKIREKSSEYIFVLLIQIGWAVDKIMCRDVWKSLKLSHPAYISMKSSQILNSLI